MNNSTVEKNAEKPNKSLIDRVDQLLLVMGKTRYWLSMELTGGKQHGILTDIARKGTMPRADRIARMAELLGTTSEYLVGTVASPQSVRSEVGVSDRKPEWIGAPREDPPVPLVGTGDCAALEVCTESGEMISIDRSSFDPDYHVRYITRPPALRGARDIYAIYFHGDSMLPLFEPGDVAFVDPRRPVGANDYVVVQLGEGDSDEVTSVLVKRLVRQNARECTFSQFNPQVTFTIPRSKVVRLHRVYRPNELFF